MNKFIQSGRLAIAGLLLAAMPLVALHAQDAEFKPVAVVSVAPVKKVLADVQYLADAAGQTDAGRMAALLTAPFTAGIDKSRPVGVVVMTNGQEFAPTAYLPVSDFDKLVTTATEQIGPPQDVGEGIKMFTPNQMPIFVKDAGNWAILAMDQEKLANPLDDPTAFLKDLPEQYDLALQFFPGNIPEIYRNVIIEQMKTGIELSLEQEADETDEEFATRKKQIADQVAEMERLFTELEDFIIGWNVDATQQGTYLDFAYTAVEGSDLAKTMAMNTDLTTEFSGFTNSDAAVNFQVTEKLSETDIARMEKQMNDLREQGIRQLESEGELEGDELESAKKVIDLAIDTLVETARTGSLDGSMMLDLAGGKGTFLAGAHVADGQRVEDGVKEMLKLAAAEGEVPSVKWDADTYQTIRLHVMQVPLDDAPPQAKEILGENPEVILGIGEKSVYIAGGNDAMARLKKAIDESVAGADTKVGVLQMQVALLPILKMVQKSSPQPVPGVDAAVEALSGGVDKFLVTVDMEQRYMRIRVLLQEGVIKAIGAGVAAQNAGGANTELEEAPAF
ncbi:hypothetical protein [Bremerella alba]|uniref:Uncharacterized protein n=1 Tax=Bremerella alba TaxID=980252 RepID=A0A7V8VA11_9BACT|nr:hypothetical protein [Bremerella alba]MBA2117474.1 hypothetical protein [Bremerella alba]